MGSLGGKDEIGDNTDREQTELRHLSNTMSETGSVWPYRPRLIFEKPLPEQNIEEKLHSDKPILEVIAEIETNVNKITLGLFNHYPYVIKDNASLAWSTTQNQSGKESEECNIKRDLDKVLGMGEFSGSRWNPAMKKITTKALPVFRIIMLLLQAYRAIFNVITWRDPYLTFWLSVGCVVLCILILLLPWRLIIFVIGVMVLGPQNWAFRVYKEFVWNKERPNRFIRVLRELLTSDHIEHKTEDLKENKHSAAVAQPIFRCHAPCNKPLDGGTHKPVAAQHVLVPYSPLICQRFSDWPPDPKYALVTAEKKSPSVMLPSHSQAYVAKERVKPQPKQPVRLPTTYELVPLPAPSISSTPLPTPGKGRAISSGGSEKYDSDATGVLVRSSQSEPARKMSHECDSKENTTANPYSHTKGTKKMEISDISNISSAIQPEIEGNINGKSGLGTFLNSRFVWAKKLTSSNESKVNPPKSLSNIMNVTGQELEEGSETKVVDRNGVGQLQEVPDESSLLEQLMQVKLELAAALTENAHCREELKKAKEEGALSNEKCKALNEEYKWYEKFMAEGLSKKALNHSAETQQRKKTNGDG